MAPTLRDVHMWPDTGWPDSRWCPPEMDDDPHAPVLEMDALLRGSKKVTELLGECLAEESITTPFASIRLVPGEPSASGDLEVEISDYMAGGEDIAHVGVPAGFHDLSVRARDALVLLMWRETLKRLVARRGGDPAAVDRAADAARRDDYEIPRYGPWKQDRSRSRRMRLVGVLRDDGFLRLRVEVEELRGERSSRLSDEIIGGSTYWHFHRAARSLRWTSSTTMEGVSVPGIILGDRGSFALDAETGSIEVRGGQREPLPIEPTGQARAIGFRFVEQPDDHIQVYWGGGGPTNEVPQEYLDEMDRLGDVVDSAEWIGWWRLVDVDEVCAYVDYLPSSSASIVRFRGRALSVTIKRPADTIPTGPAAVLLARQDTESVLARIAERRKIQPAPALG
ncbi:hypothetical protein W824_06110 [Clavibacter cf. michiganensis LMG 26808]|uniref:Uncharacterized protein n=3 Tax=Clavibacter TaxID=1573 RepID=A0A399NZK5_9MICO|nr:hypothetical protein W824_06110 [Clavibacter cf. michiganensis LMG 26808]RII98879.1 hypothetical protein DZF96_01100 [Clavibacter michiganensis]